MPDRNDPSQLSLRTPCFGDVETLYGLRNSPEARAQTALQEEIPYCEHLTWFVDAIKCPHKNVVRVAEIPTSFGGVFIGLIYIDRDGTFGPEIRLMVTSSHHSHGMEEEMVRQFFAEHVSETDKLCLVDCLCAGG